MPWLLNFWVATKIMSLYLMFLEAKGWWKNLQVKVRREIDKGKRAGVMV